MADKHSTIDAAAAEASAQAAANIISGKLAEKPVSVLADPPAGQSPDVKPAPSAAKNKLGRKVAELAETRTESRGEGADPAPVAATAQRDSVPENTTDPIKQLKDKIMENTTNTGDSAKTDFAAKAQETVADMQNGMKTAYDKGTDLTAFSKGNFDAVVEAGKVLAAGMQDLGRTAVEDARLAAETVTNDVKAMAAVKSPTELFQLQGEIARRNLDTIVARTAKNAEVMMKLANEMFAPLSTRASVAMDRLNKAA